MYKGCISLLNENKFYKALEDIFVGAKVDGNSGYVNLMKAKEKYYSKVLDVFKKEVNKDKEIDKEFREEFFDKLFTFFNRYFNESGSVYFTKTENYQKIYEQVYTDNEDVTLFWKTHMLYYVKSDVLFESVSIELEDDEKNKKYNFYFDVKELKNRQNNEKREIIYNYHETKNIGDKEFYIFNVLYSTHGKKTKLEEINKETEIPSNILEKGFNAFEKQSEVDFFINKNAEKFLTEQLNLYLNQIMIADENIFEQKRLNQLKSIKKFSMKVIQFISQFEGELVRIWNKPKFSLNGNYVITSNLLTKEILKNIIEHRNIEKQINEWKELEIIGDNFVIDKIYDKQNKYPLDSKYFKDIEKDLLSVFEYLDKDLMGRLIFTENYQGLNTLKDKYKEKIDLIYIDPPFNTGSDFDYVDKFQDSTWLTLMENRLYIAKDILSKKGSFYLHLDYRADYLGNLLLNNTFGKNNFKNKIVWAYTGVTPTKKAFRRKYDSIFFYVKDIEESIFNMQYVPYKALNATKKLSHGSNRESTPESMKNLKERGKEIEDWWDDIYTIDRVRSEMLGFQTQKPEKLLKRIISASTNKDSVVLDYHLGSGTTISVAQKLGRKWIGMEMGDHFYTKVLPRLKRDLYGVDMGISKDSDVNWKGGGIFKYYKLEQYEDTLKNMKYNEGQETIFNEDNPFGQYIFFADNKLSDVIEANKDEIELDFDKLYKDIDWPETISNLLGLPIKKIYENNFVLDNEGKEYEINIDFKNMDNQQKIDFIKLIKPLIWWGE